jgi:hypothetical protein
MATKKLKVFEINDCEWFADYSLEEAIQHYKEFTGCDDPDNFSEACKVPYSEMQRLKYVTEETKKNGEPKLISFARQLKTFTEPGYFATTEF